MKEINAARGFTMIFLHLGSEAAGYRQRAGRCLFNSGRICARNGIVGTQGIMYAIVPGRTAKMAAELTGKVALIDKPGVERYVRQRLIRVDQSSAGHAQP